MALITQIISIMFPIVAIVAVGAVLGRTSKLEMRTANHLNLDVFVPALVFSSLSDKTFSLAPHISLALAGLAIVLLAGVIAFLISKLTHYPLRTIAPPMMFHNAGNVGLPIMSLAFGKPGLVTGLVLFLVGNLLHYGLGTYILSAGQGIKVLLRQTVIWAAIVALAINVSPIVIPESAMLPITMLGQIAIPLMLFSLGVRIASIDLQEWKIGLLFAVLTPTVGFCIAFALVMLFDFTAIQAGSLLLFGTLPPAVMNFLFAERFNQQPKSVASIVLLGNLFAMITLPIALAYVLTNYS
ncbi:MAG: AEC family transporter [Gammaproteobacteria bacterium]|nr:MAG: AEC family transporter [Gammaproteobacteria bacterium]